MANYNTQKILHVVSGLVTGGAEMMLVRLIEAKGDSCCHAVISLRDEGVFGERIRRAGVPLFCLNWHRPMAWYSQPAILKQLRAFSPQFIFGWMYQGNLGALLLARLLKNVPVIWSVHSSLHNIRDRSLANRMILDLNRRLSGQPACIVFVSTTSRTHHEEYGFRPRRVVTIPNGIDTGDFTFSQVARERVRSELCLSQNEELIGSVGRYNPVKAYPIFLRAAALYRRTNPLARFCLVGRGLERTNSELMSLVRELGLEDVLLLPGEREDVRDFYSAFDLFTLSSESEAFPVVLLEAMACERPCVVTDVGDCREILGEDGFTVSPGDHTALCHGWATVTRKPDAQRRLIGGGLRSRVKEMYSFSRMMDRYGDLFSNIEELAGRP